METEAEPATEEALADLVLRELTADAPSGAPSILLRPLSDYTTTAHELATAGNPSALCFALPPGNSTLHAKVLSCDLTCGSCGARCAVHFHCTVTAVTPPRPPTHTEAFQKPWEERENLIV